MLFREVFRMYYEDGLSYAEIARGLDVPLGTVSTRMLRARQQIRRALEAGVVARERGRDRVTSKTIRWEESAGPAFLEGQTRTPPMQYQKGTAMKIKKIEQSKDSKKDAKQPAGVQVKTDIKAGAAALVAVCG
jgi:transposase-like protein